VVKIQITSLEDESVRASHTENVFGFTAKNIYVEVWLGRDNLSAALYRISISMRITTDVTVVLAVWLLLVSLQQIFGCGTKSTVSELKTSFRYRPTFQLPCWPLWRKVHQPFCLSVPNVSAERLTIMFTHDALGSNIDPRTYLFEGVFCNFPQTHQPLSATAPLSRPLLTVRILNL
jgi:hypothetical protein